MRVWRMRIALVLATWLALELTALAGLTVLRVARGVTYRPLTTSLTANQRAGVERLLASPATYVAYSAVMGWTIRPGGVSPLSRANAQGLRADREYAALPSRDTTRIAAFGDSFTHGDDVVNGATWPSVLERALPRVEVLNFGVGGYGLDQAYLRWREEGATFHPQVVLIGYLTEDITRHVSVFRPFYYPETGLPFAKPRFVLQSGELRLQPNPASRIEDYRALLADPAPVLRRFGMYDYYYQHRAHASAWDRSALVRLIKLIRQALTDASTAPLRGGLYNESSEAFAITTRLFDRFVHEVRAQHAVSLIVVFPTRADFERLAKGRTRGHQALLDHFAREGYDYVDVLEAFPECRNACDLPAIIPGHFTEAGNRVVGEYLARALRARGLDGPRS